MDPPKKDQVNHALNRLKNLGALDRTSRITLLGCQVRNIGIGRAINKSKSGNNKLDPFEKTIYTITLLFHLIYRWPNFLLCQT